jgi:predicted nucleic acid-binding protein
LVIADASPLIALTKMRRLELLPAVYGDVRIAPAVRRETLDDGRKIAAPGVDLIELALDEGAIGLLRLTAREKSAAERILKTSRLHAGEAESLALARSRKALVMLDDREARMLAAALGVSCVGTAGFLLEAFWKGRLTASELEDAVLELSRTIWLAPAVVAETLRRAKGGRA